MFTLHTSYTWVLALFSTSTSTTTPIDSVDFHYSVAFTTVVPPLFIWIVIIKTIDGIVSVYKYDTIYNTDCTFCVGYSSPSFILTGVSASPVPTVAGFIILIYSERRNYPLYLDLHAAMLFVAAKDRDTIVLSEPIKKAVNVLFTIH